jgi:hypothetical protein
MLKQARPSSPPLLSQIVFSPNRFCFCPRGITPGTRRVFEALARGCIPVIVSDGWTLPYENLVPRLGQGEWRCYAAVYGHYEAPQLIAISLHTT